MGQRISVSISVTFCIFIERQAIIARLTIANDQGEAAFGSAIAGSGPCFWKDCLDRKMNILFAEPRTVSPFFFSRSLLHLEILTCTPYQCEDLSEVSLVITRSPSD
jgi:hypothetical protein